MIPLLNLSYIMLKTGQILCMKELIYLDSLQRHGLMKLCFNQSKLAKFFVNARSLKWIILNYTNNSSCKRFPRDQVFRLKFLTFLKETLHDKTYDEWLWLFACNKDPIRHYLRFFYFRLSSSENVNKNKKYLVNLCT